LFSEKKDHKVFRGTISMLKELILRFVIGGTVVSAFAVLGDLFKPKSFAGLFGAAPSVALATVALTVSTEGPEYVAIEARSMVLGAIAFFVYASCASWLMMRYQLRALAVTSSLILVWLFAALGLWAIWLR
jgi:uncharacterized membrane protein (GlpM family)